MGTECEDLVAAWDFSVGISTEQITDKSGNQLHGYLVNLPTRGVCGHAWDGSEHCWHKKPEHYAAIHFHNDDLYDCAWESDFEVRLPDNISSGVYAIHLHSGSEEYYIPFSVRPPRGTKTAPVAFILPTASYMAYANNRMGIDVPETEIVYRTPNSDESNRPFYANASRNRPLAFMICTMTGVAYFTHRA